VFESIFLDLSKSSGSKERRSFPELLISSKTEIMIQWQDWIDLVGKLMRENFVDEEETTRVRLDETDVIGSCFLDVDGEKVGCMVLIVQGSPSKDRFIKPAKAPLNTTLYELGYKAWDGTTTDGTIADAKYFGPIQTNPRTGLMYQFQYYEGWDDVPDDVELEFVESTGQTLATSATGN
jgi:hypothetical protein